MWQSTNTSSRNGSPGTTGQLGCGQAPQQRYENAQINVYRGHKFSHTQRKLPASTAFGGQMVSQSSPSVWNFGANGAGCVLFRCNSFLRQKT